MSAETQDVLLDLRIRCQKAERALGHLLLDVEGEEHTRLAGKANGVRLVIGYINEAIEEAKPQGYRVGGWAPADPTPRRPTRSEARAMRDAIQILNLEEGRR